MLLARAQTAFLRDQPASCRFSKGQSRTTVATSQGLKGLQDLHSHAPGTIAAAGLISASPCHVCSSSKGPPGHHRESKSKIYCLNGCTFVYFPATSKHQNINKQRANIFPRSYVCFPASQHRLSKIRAAGDPRLATRAVRPTSEIIIWGLGILGKGGGLSHDLLYC